MKTVQPEKATATDALSTCGEEYNRLKVINAELLAALERVSTVLGDHLDETQKPLDMSVFAELAMDVNAALAKAGRRA